MQDCSRYDELLNALVDGELNEAEMRRLDAHLATCADCRKYLRVLETIHEELAQELPEPPETLRKGIMYKISVEKKRRFGAFGRWAVSAAVFCIALLGVIKLTGNNLKSMSGVVAETAKSAAATMADAAAEGFDYIREHDSAADEASAADTMMTYAVSVAPGAEAPWPQPNGVDDSAMANGAVSGASAEEDSEVKSPAPTESNEANGDNAEFSDDLRGEAIASIYDAANLPGYDAGMEALNGETAYSGVGILYALPEGMPGKKWKELPAPTGQRRWLVKKSIMDELAAENVFDELYFGDLLADSGLIIQLTDKEL